MFLGILSWSFVGLSLCRRVMPVQYLLVLEVDSTHGADYFRVGGFLCIAASLVSQPKMGSVVKLTAQTLRKRISAQKKCKRQEKLEKEVPS